MATEPEYLRLEDCYEGRMSLLKFGDVKEALRGAGFLVFPKEAVATLSNSTSTYKEYVLMRPEFKDHLIGSQAYAMVKYAVSQGAIETTERVIPESNPEQIVYTSTMNVILAEKKQG